MQNKQLKRPYFPPEMTIVDFQVERGFDTSDVEIQNDFEKQMIDGLIYFQMMNAPGQEQAYNESAYFGNTLGSEAGWGTSFWSN